MARLRRVWARALSALVFVLLAHAASADTVRLPDGMGVHLGKHLHFLQEEAQPLSLEQARARFHEGKFQQGKHDVLDFGLAPRPIWLRLELDNTGVGEVRELLMLGITWYDRLDAYVLHDGHVRQHVLTGDGMAHPEGFQPPLGFALPVEFAPGVNELFVRIESIDPVPVPLQIISPREFEAEKAYWNYFYGFFYGFLAALCAYNLLLFAGMRERSYLYYSLALIALMICNISYTGHGMAWFWPDAPGFQSYVGSAFMIIYSVAALTFAGRLLDLESEAPGALRIVRVFSGLALAGLVAGLLLQSKFVVLVMAFVFTALLTLGMPVLGVLAVYRGWAYGRYFLAASTFAMLGVASTELATWGVITFSESTYHGTEYGLIIESTLLALALAYRMRKYRQEGLLAHVDALTGLNNRRAFLESGANLVNAHDRRKHSCCLAIMDLDFFKNINDQYGHKAGDQALMAVAGLLARHCRAGDVIARWGGEEFILLMRETELSQAEAYAERLRQAIADLHLPVGQGDISLSVSIGIVQRTTENDLDELISRADTQLYRAKSEGRNRVCVQPV